MYTFQEHFLLWQHEHLNAYVDLGPTLQRFVPDTEQSGLIFRSVSVPESDSDKVFGVELNGGPLR